MAASTFAAALIAGALVAALSWIPLITAAGVATFAWLAAGSAYLVLGALLVVRGIADYFTEVPLIAGLNAGAVIGVGVVMIAGVRMINTPQPRGLLPAAFILLALVFWFVLGVGEYGADPSLVREFVRTLALVAVALIALNHRGSLTPSRLATIVVISSCVPAGLAVIEGVVHWEELTTGDFRARGSIAHENSAGLFFALAIIFAAWKWSSDSGGRRYLAAGVLLAVALLFTKSMGGLGQAVLSLLVFGLLQGSRANRVTILLLVVGFIVFFVTDPLGISRAEELETTNIRATQGADHTNTLDWRIVNAGYFLGEWRDAPLLGHGFGTTADIIWPWGYETHSDPLRLLVETGLIGTLLFTLAFASLINELVVRWRLTPAPEASFFAAMLGLFAGLTAHSFVTHATFETAPMFLLAALIGATLTFGASGAPKASVIPRFLQPLVPLRHRRST